jgi:hypothetical protein
VANHQAFEGLPSVIAINNTSGGRGKKEDSAKAKPKRAGTPYGESAQDSIQSYNCLTKSIPMEPEIYRE